MNKETVQMIEEFQCPGCMLGSNTKCGSFKPDEGYGASCKAHVLGTAMQAFNNKIALGLPTGFNKPGIDDSGKSMRSQMAIRLWDKGEQPEWDHLNVPVWAMKQNGHLFVRTYCPRLNLGYVDVIRGGTLDLVPQAIDVAKFADEID